MSGQGVTTNTRFALVVCRFMRLSRLRNRVSFLKGPWRHSDPINIVSLDVERVVEKYCELNTAVARLWKAHRVAVARIEVRSCIIRRKDDE